MNIILNTSSMTPIYEQIVDAIKQMIATGTLATNDPLPSVRSLSKDLKISALTVKKAYDQLEEEGFAVTIHGKGTYVNAFHPDMIREEQLKEIEKELENIVEKAKRYDISIEEMISMLQLMS